MVPADWQLQNTGNRLGERLADKALTVATAESCTGGWVAKVLTDRPGSSAYVLAGLVTYSNAAKQALLGVPPAVLEQHGAVSEAVVRDMVDGALKVTGADLAVSVSGVAGPGGGTPEKPVGTVWFAWGRGGERTVAVCKQFPGSRDDVRRQSVLFALQGLMDYVGNL